MKQLRILAALAAVALIAAGVFVYFEKPLAPEVSFTILQGGKADTVRLDTASLRGKVTLVSFWATTCSTCIEEMPDLADTYKKFAERGLDIIAVAMEYDPEPQVRAYAEKAALPFKVALDRDGEVALNFQGVRMTPTAFLIDRQGRIVHKYLGKPDFGALHALLEKLLAESA
ncbi:MAG: TlpA family protein disulfide reductase [Betaproteobacteria bacterium]|nr:TlpA family protein disulfide reductase [Betaproteobacteria bacterium]